jgi:hypothetical protein
MLLQLLFFLDEQNKTIYDQTQYANKQITNSDRGIFSKIENGKLENYSL